MMPLVLAVTEAPAVHLRGRRLVGGEAVPADDGAVVRDRRFLVSITSFTRIVIVLSFLRQALGTPQLPPNQVVIALSLALTGFVMAPTFTRCSEAALAPYLDDQITGSQALDRGSGAGARLPAAADPARRSAAVLRTVGPRAPHARQTKCRITIAVPAFMVSELTTAFRMGLFLFIPLLLIDLLVSAILMSLGMMMVPPTLVSLPLKVGIFLLADGWHLLVQSLVRSFG